MKLTKRYIEREPAKMFIDGINLATAKADGKNHLVEVRLSDWDEYLFGHKIRKHQWLSGIVDDTREFGGKLGLGKQTVLFKCYIHAPKKEIKE